MNMTPQQLNRLLSESADKMTELYDTIKVLQAQIKNETADYNARLYRLNKQHVEDLLARQELLEALKNITDCIVFYEMRGLGKFVPEARAAILKWSQK